MLPSSAFVSCAASRMVKGRTRTQTEMLLEFDEAIGADTPNGGTAGIGIALWPDGKMRVDVRANRPCLIR